MVQESYYAVGKDAPIKLGEEECAGGMVQWPDDAVVKDAPIKLTEEECAGGMVQDIALQTQMNKT